MFDRRAVVLAAAALAAAPGCGNSHGLFPADASAAPDMGGAAMTMTTTTTTTTINCGDPNQPIDPTALIDDMEDGNFQAAMVGGRSGSWWAGGDTTPGASMQPDGNAPPELIPGGRCGSRYAMHVTGTGFNDWGAMVTVSFGFGANAAGVQGLLPYDAHTRTGITFWARIGDTSTNQIRFAVSDEHARPEAGICVVNGTIGQECYDTFGVDFTQLATEWHQYRIPFAGLSQRNFGVQAPTVDTTQLYDIEFTFYAGRIFDFWVDDIYFY
jgi:hypothetical protein